MQARPKNVTGMPDKLKAGLESLSGLDLSNVRVHSNSSEPAQLNAHAYAQGNDIHLGPGQERHMAHEAWHVVQQRRGLVGPTRVSELDTRVTGQQDLAVLELRRLPKRVQRAEWHQMALDIFDMIVALP